MILEIARRALLLFMVLAEWRIPPEITFTVEFCAVILHGSNLCIQNKQSHKFVNFLWQIYLRFFYGKTVLPLPFSWTNDFSLTEVWKVWAYYVQSSKISEKRLDACRLLRLRSSFQRKLEQMELSLSARSVFLKKFYFRKHRFQTFLGENAPNHIQIPKLVQLCEHARPDFPGSLLLLRTIGYHLRFLGLKHSIILFYRM